MIVRPRPSALHLFFVRRGSIFPHIASKLLSITLLSCMVVGFYEYGWLQWLDQVSAPPFSLLGLALSVFLGFRNSACYDRWWEARKQWGELIIQARGLARESHALLPGDDNAGLRRQTIQRCIAFAHALAAHLRGQDGAAACAAWVSPDELTILRQRRNVPDTLLIWINQDLAQCVREQRISDVLYRGLEQRLDTLAASQAVCERIKSTPTPFAYTLLLHRTAWLFCMLLPFGLVSSLELLTPVLVTIIAYTFFGLDALGDELEEPFGLSDNDLPLSAMVRGIEIDLLESLGDTLPAPLQPQDYVLR